MEKISKLDKEYLKLIFSIATILMLVFFITLGSYNFAEIYDFLIPFFGEVTYTILTLVIICACTNLLLGIIEYLTSIIKGYSDIDIFLISLINLFKYIVNSTWIILVVFLTIQLISANNFKVMLLAILSIIGLMSFIVLFKKNGKDTVIAKRNLEYVVFISIIYFGALIILFFYNSPIDLERNLFNIGMVVSILLTIIFTNLSERGIDIIIKKRKQAVLELVDKKKGSLSATINILIALVTVYVFTDTMYVGEKKETVSEDEKRSIAEAIINSDQFILMVFLIGAFSYIIHYYIYSIVNKKSN